LPKPTAIGTLPTIAVMGAAVATAMNTTATRPTAFGFRRCTPACVLRITGPEFAAGMVSTLV
jgi:hypothetical protein